MNKYQARYYAWLDKIGVKIIKGFEFDENDRSWATVK